MLEAALKRQITPIGSGAHIVHNVLSHAVSKTGPIDLENVVVKMHYHFHIFSQRQEKFKEFCELVDCSVRPILNHCHTRWLSIYPCVERILQLYDALKEYFLTEKNVPLVLLNFFTQDESYFRLLFIEPQLKLCHDILQVIQGEDLAAIEIWGH